ncbi:hypothetical protein ZHAS_00012540 [Anopheles sinensis]|uniref:Uncharacterized protein n=1 Tax=Anopheles sinensis TaxID=74873 RepID=A0A084W358_ANOSI|nr:hypothetical protein ZHAS_00012540 [Anopheles sinensis]
MIYRSATINLTSATALWEGIPADGFWVRSVSFQPVPLPVLSRALRASIRSGP